MFQAIVFHPSAPILVADDDRKYQDASVGAATFLGIPRGKIVGRRLDDFVVPAVDSALSGRWQEFLKAGQQTGTLQLLGPDGTPREIEYKAKSNVLPVRHLLILRDRPANQGDDSAPREALNWAHDYGLFLLDADGRIVEWYAGAERIYGYTSDEVIGKDLSFFYPPETWLDARVERKLKRASEEGYAGGENWHLKKDGSRFWANAITMALRDETGLLQGFARVVRDFTNRHEQDQKLARRRPRIRPTDQSTIAGVASGEFDSISEINDRFLDLIGYSREDLLANRIVWANLTPKEYAGADEFAHEEGLRFGACSPFRKELIRKDGKRIRVLVSTAVLKLSPFRWITFVTDERELESHEPVEHEVAVVTRNFPEMIGTSRALKRVLSQVELVAPTDATVLVLGETGTGKELIARAIHRLSPRRNFPFISVNCAALPTGLLESELFGYERGAFTGALQQKIGRFEMANHGTLFLDEVGDIPLELQPKLLRALQEKSFERLGSTRTTPIDIRLVAATNRNLTQMLEDKLFRSDLYYRLKVFPVTIPPLRERSEDIGLLARHFTQKYAAKMGRKVNRISPETLKTLVNWIWPGNIRELENFIERCVILSPGPSLHVPLAELTASPELETGSALKDVEREHILRILRESAGVVSIAARRLRVPRTSLNGLMTKHGISRSQF